MGNIGEGIQWKIREFARLQDAKSPENETSRPHFRDQAKIFWDTRFSKNHSIPLYWSFLCSNKVQSRHPFARPEVRPKEPGVQVTRLRRTPGCFFRYQIIFSGGYTDLFHVWSRPVCHQKFFTVVLFLCGWFAMSYAPFARLCRGFVSRRVVNSTLARNMASERRHKILVTRRVPQAAIEILKDSKR